MSLEVFTQPWARAWADELRSSLAYRRAALKWEGSLMIEMEVEAEGGGGDGTRPAVFLDLWHGDCRGARLPNDDDREAADSRRRRWPDRKPLPRRGRERRGEPWAMNAERVYQTVGERGLNHDLPVMGLWRIERVEKARGKSLDEVLRLEVDAAEAEAP